MSLDSREVSYGQTEDEYITIDTLADEIRFKMCMKLYKSYLTIAELEQSITKKGLETIKNTR